MHAEHHMRTKKDKSPQDTGTTSFRGINELFKAFTGLKMS